jgi:hypothetical protein
MLSTYVTLATPNININDVIQGANKLSKNDVTWGKANSSDVTP